MGIHRDNGAYSANVEGYLVIGRKRIRLAKTNGVTCALAEPCELAPGTIGDLVIIVDGKKDSKMVSLPNGVTKGQVTADYNVIAPF